MIELRVKRVKCRFQVLVVDLWFPLPNGRLFCPIEVSREWGWGEIVLLFWTKINSDLPANGAREQDNRVYRSYWAKLNACFTFPYEGKVASTEGRRRMGCKNEKRQKKKEKRWKMKDERKREWILHTSGKQCIISPTKGKMYQNHLRHGSLDTFSGSDGGHSRTGWCTFLAAKSCTSFSTPGKIP